ncbi:MAG: hypothetical protein LBQ45_02305 [Mycoplasmataceae bacterium]|nr:hypothetical protein [Mycoplasmataceae bacterium]
MCRILLKKDNQVKYDKDELYRSWNRNKDGTGIIYYDETKKELVVKKYLQDILFEEIYEYIKSVENMDHVKNIAVHFRLCSAGMYV